MITEIVNNYSEYIRKQGWNQEEAAKAIGCSRQHMNRILNKVVTPSMALCAKMEAVMGKPKDTNLEACKKVYPIGNAFIQFYDPPNSYSGSTDYKDFIWKEGAFHYEPNDTGACLSLLLYSHINKNFYFCEAVFWKILGYFTSDGYIFSPVVDMEGDGLAFNQLNTNLVYVQNPYANCPFSLKSFENFIRENIIAYNGIHGTDYIPLFSEKECQNIMEAVNE